MPTETNDKTSTQSWLRRLGPPLGIGAGVGVAGGFLLGRAISVPNSTAFWDVAAQPTATVATGTAVLAAAYFAFHNGEETRTLESQHHHELMDRDRESNLQDRYTAAGKQLGDDNSAVREAGAYAIAALADDWLRYGDHTQEFGMAHSQARACVNLLCSYLRANRREEFGGQFEREEAVVRSSIVGVLRERTDAWKKIEVTWITAENLSENARMVIDLSGANLREENFSQANLEAALLVDTDLSRANLEGTNLQRARLLRAKLIHSRLIQTDFRAAFLTESDFTDANGFKPDFHSATGIRPKFVDARLRGANFDLATLRWSDFTGADLSNVNMRMNLWRANLAGASLNGADFTNTSKLESANFDDETTWSKDTKWPEGFTPPKGSLKEARNPWLRTRMAREAAKK